MEGRLQLRLEELKKEFEIGQTRLRELETQQANLQQTLLRISGAIQVLDELLSTAPQPESAGDAPMDSAVTSGSAPLKAAQ
jgi:predicted nuclease with TOPRIM domain